MSNLKKRGSHINSFFVTKRGQVTVFIIIGIILIVGIIAYFLLQGTTLPGGSKELKQGENAYLACISNLAKSGAKLAGQQGGYIYLDELPFFPGSDYAPTSSQLDFYGNPVPYWYYVSGNNILREQKPTKEQMQTDLARYIYEGISTCDFSDINAQGILINIYNGSIDVVINNNNIDVSLDNPVFISFDNQSATVSQHDVTVNSKLGKFFALASDVLENEKENTFLEYYALDVMRLYAPVTGVELGCAPRFFNEVEIVRNISQGLALNFAQLKLSGNYYSLNNKENSYYVVDLGQKVDENVNFMYSSAWPTRIEMYGDKVVQPVGTQAGLGMMGLCFVQYHFVYDINFPVLVQFYDGEELFQFGMVTIIQNSQARNATYSSDEVSLASDICANANQEITVSTYDLNLKPVSANLRFSCLGDSCEVGQTQIKSDEAKLTAKVPQCMNGVIQASAEGYSPAETIVSTNKETSADILMKKIYTTNVSVTSVGNTIIMFSSVDYSTVLNYPSEKTVSLVEGDYNITAFAYSNASISFPGIKDRKCLEIPSSSIGGVFGMTEKKCFDLDIPAQTIDSALVGGGKAFDYFTGDMLENAKQIKIIIPSFKVPTRLDELENNYAKLDVSRVDINFES